jgi:3-oxoacyl-[acyl-carrier protein] reductase
VTDTRPVAIVTGAGSGIGAAIARRLAADGHLVVVNDVDGSRAAAMAGEIAAAGSAAIPAVADVSDSAAVDAMFDAVEAAVGPVEVLVNNAGVGGNAAIRNVTDEFWERVLSVDLHGVLYCTRRALGPMRERRSGSVVTISSRAWLGWWGQSAYAAAKAGVVGMTRALAVEFGSRNVRVNAVAPGIIDTPLLRDRDPELLDRLLMSVPLGRPGTAEEVAAAVAFLVRSRAITGQLLYVCGGKSVYAYPDWKDA